MNQQIKKICFCGRPNVGKSSLFNRLISKKRALVLDEPGVTRDVFTARVSLEDGYEKVELADLAGLESYQEKKSSASDKEKLHALATEAALSYLKKSDLILFVVDARQSLSHEDKALARLVRSTGIPVLVVLTKVESEVVENNALAEVAELGWEKSVSTSAEHNLGIQELKETLLSILNTPKISQETLEENEQTLFRLGVYGRPNVGKSTLVNLLLGEKRMITSPIAGTTVDTVDSEFIRVETGKRYRILDTAGIRKKSKTEQGVEVLSVVQALKSVSNVDVALFLIDGYEGITDQDEKIAGELLKSGKPIVILVNKWDLCRTKKEAYAERLRKELDFLDFAPILFLSAERGEGVDPLWDLLDEIVEQRTFIAPTPELNRFLELVEGANNPTGVKLYYASQTGKNPPAITFLVSDPEKVHFAYEGYLKNQLRSKYGWMGSPLRLIFKKRKRSASKKARDGGKAVSKKSYFKKKSFKGSQKSQSGNR